MQVSLEKANESERELRLTIRFEPDTLRLQHSLIGVVVHLGGCSVAGAPGAPALPVRNVRIALPAGTRISELVVEAGETTPVGEGPVPLAPLQPTRPGAASAPAYRRPEEGRWKGRRERGRRPCDDGDPVAPPFPLPAYVAPDPELYAAAAREPPARLVTTDETGSTPVATVLLRPVRIAGGGHLEFTAAVTLILKLERREEPGDGPSHVVSRAQALRDISLLRRTVINPDQVLDYSHRFPIELFTEADYLIVTDNRRWDAEAQVPLEPAGGNIVASFQRLAKWKRQRGLSVKLATITDIVGGRWGDFRTGSRDLQETLRNFLKMAHAEWGVAWVLIGGDAEIVPVRYVAGSREGEIRRQADDPPPDTKSVWTGSHLRMRVVALDVSWSPWGPSRLVRIDDGSAIPYDAAGTSDSTNPGWYFTTGDSYDARSMARTDFVRVNGPASLVDADLRFLHYWNTIPTDLYYSSLVGWFYDQPGKHDWDLLDNGIYGQCVEGIDVDGINYTPTVSLGRAPVANAADADAFVDKLIAYEKFERPDGTPLDEAWPRRAVLVSENWDSSWGGRIGIGATADNPPGDNLYHHPAGAAHSLIHLEAMPDWNRSLLCHLAEDDVRLLPYRLDAAPGVSGWFFARSATDLTPNILSFSIFGTTIEIPLPSQWLAVFAPEEELTPASYILNSTSLDGSAIDQEQLREQLSISTGLDAPLRLYEDIFDMSPAQLAAAPIELITTERLRTALDAGPHIVSLSGHGWSGGCCRLDHTMASGLANGFHTFIGYADSCLTNSFDGWSMSEALLNNANGGAVAYVGNTRYSWVSVGDDFQRAFFDKWAILGGDAHIGLLVDTRAGLIDEFWWGDARWSVLSLHLMGCPEMPIWWTQPLWQRIPEIPRLYDPIWKWWGEPRPDPPFEIDLPYRDEWDVTRLHVRQGEHEQRFAVRGDAAEARLTGFRPGPATVTLARAGHKPVVREVQIGRRGGGLLWLGLALLVVLIVATLLIRGL